MKNCYFCGCQLSKEKEEHIIPNALGGKLKSRNILCSKHNNELSNIDNSLCNDLLNITNLINPKRDNGEVAEAKFKLLGDAGEVKEIVRSGNGEVKGNAVKVTKTDDNKLVINMQLFHTPHSKAEEENINKLRKILQDWAKSHSKDNEWVEDQLSKILANIEIIETNNNVFHFQAQFNKNGESFLGLLKIAIGYYAYCTDSVDPIEKVIRRLEKRDHNLVDIINYYYTDDFLYTDSIYHTLYLKCDKKQQVAYVIISLYGAYQAFVLLSSNYQGEDKEYSYCYDLLKHSEIPFSNHLVLTKDEIFSLLKEYPVNLAEKMKNGFDNVLKHLIKKPNATLSEDVVKRILDSISKKIIKYPFIESEERFYIKIKEILIEEFKNETEKCFGQSIPLNNIKQTMDGLKLAFPYKNYLDYMFPFVSSQIISKIVVNAYRLSLNGRNVDKQKIKEESLKMLDQFDTGIKYYNEKLKENRDKISEAIDMTLSKAPF